MKCCFQKVLEPTKINVICQKAGNTLKLGVLTQMLNLKGFTCDLFNTLYLLYAV